MAFSPVANASASGSASPITTASIDTTGADLLVVVATQWAGAAAGTVTDSKSNSWSSLTVRSGTIPYCRIWYSQPTSVGSGHTFTYDNGSSPFGTISVQAWSGALASPFDVQNGATGTAASLATGSVSPSASDSLIIAGFCATDGTSGANSINLGFTATSNIAFNSGVNEGGSMAYLVQGAASAVNPTWTVGSGSGELSAAIAVFKGVAGVPRYDVSRPAEHTLDDRAPGIFELLNVNEWAGVRGIEKWVDDWLEPATGAAGPTGTLATTNADDTLNASGTTTIVGTLAKTNSDDTSAASGTTTILGTLAKTNSDDTIAASGTTTILGTIATTNADDTLAASGSVGATVTGTLATTNADDTLAASGNITILGTLATTNANDTLAASGTSTIVGTLAKTNADDTLSASGSVGAAPAVTGTKLPMTGVGV